MSAKTQIISISLSLTSDYVQNHVGNKVIAEIHSIYNKTINILTNGRIFALQPKDSYISPISLITDLTAEQFQHLPLLPKQIYQFHFNYQYCAIFHSKLTACTSPSKSQFRFYSDIAKTILQQANTGGLQLLLRPYTDDLILSACKQYLSQAEYFYHSHDDENSAKTLVKLIGLGIGLTPSGDDFLCGFLGVFQYLKRTDTLFYQQLTQEIKYNLNKTNLISRQFLNCALEKQFSFAILDFFNLTEIQEVPINKLIKIFENIGHSSGMDTLFGIYYACNLLKNDKD